MSDQFVYVTYVRTTPEKLFDALTKPEFTRAYWWGVWQDCEWQEGSSWRMMLPGGRVADAGKVVEIDRPRRLVLAWRNEFKPELKAEGWSRAAFEIEQKGQSVKLTVTHRIDRDGSKLIEAVSNGWPMILSSLKTFLETGEPLADPRQPV